uniref:Uncharacterized protein n=1 Tax=Mesocestoides corti TaxID=53468 RepID=A0A5K3G254_MESCO
MPPLHNTLVAERSPISHRIIADASTGSPPLMGHQYSRVNATQHSTNMQQTRCCVTRFDSTSRRNHFHTTNSALYSDGTNENILPDVQKALKYSPGCVAQ